MATFKTNISTPEALVFNEDVESLVVPGTGGRFGVLAGHAPMIGALSPGVLKVSAAGQATFFAVGKGMVEVTRQGVSLMTGFAFRAQNEADARQYLAKLAPRAQAPAAQK